jgi:hypothetical protein
MSNVEVIEKMYHCFRDADMETLKKEIFHPDILWHLPGRHPIAGTKKGINEVLGFFGALKKLGLKVTPMGISDIDKDTVAEFYRGSGEANGAIMDAFNCNFYRIQDNKIVEVTVFMSNQHNYDDFCWAAFKLKPVPDCLI